MKECVIAKKVRQKVKTSEIYYFENSVGIVDQQRSNVKPITPRTKRQAEYLSAILHHPITFGLGPAGVGKSYIATALAAQELEARRINKLIITRPISSVGESLGFLPGTLEEKYALYLQPIRQILDERMGASQVDYCLKHRRIEPFPLAFMRGVTFNDTWVILDEAVASENNT